MFHEIGDFQAYMVFGVWDFHTSSVHPRYQREDVCRRVRQRDHFQNLRRFSRLTCRVGRRVGVWTVTRFSRRVPNRTPVRAGVLLTVVYSC